MKFVKIKKYVEKSFEDKPSFLIELDDNGVIREFISNGCVFIENTDRNREFLVEEFNCLEELETLLNSQDIENYNCIKDARYMFHNYKELTELNLELPSATDCWSMLRDCSSLVELNLKLPSATNCWSMLRNCSSLKELNLELPSATNCEFMLHGCSSLVEENTKITYLWY